MWVSIKRVHIRVVIVVTMGFSPLFQRVSRLFPRLGIETAHLLFHLDVVLVRALVLQRQMVRA